MQSNIFGEIESILLNAEGCDTPLLSRPQYILFEILGNQPHFGQCDLSWFG